MPRPMPLRSIVFVSLSSLSLAGILLAGCATTPEPVTTATVSPNLPTVITYPTGRYQLYGDGVATPYYWVWIPAGAAAPPGIVTPPPPPMPRANVVTYNEGRYQLYGNGSTVPYYWVWVPSGSTVPSPPPPPPVPR